MDLLTANPKISHQLDELPSDGGSIIRHLKTLSKLIDLFEHRGPRQVIKCLRSGQRD